jgi:predicted dehydrogenase
VVGVGSFGRNHARVCADLQKNPVPGLKVELVAIVDTDKSLASEVAKEFGATVFPSVEEMLKWAKVQAVSVCVPTSAHLTVAEKLLEGGADVLIEKPLASNMFEADDLLRIANRTISSDLTRRCAQFFR